MTRTPPLPDPDTRTPSQLRRELVRLHAWAGAPGARRLTTTAADLGLVLARSTTHDLISGARLGGLPNRDFVHAFVMSCLRHSGVPDADADAWDRAWLTVVQSHGQIPSTPAPEPTNPPRPRSPHRVILIATSATVLLAAAVTIPLLMTSSDTPPPAQAVSTAEIQDIHCPRDGQPTSWVNHHSQLYLAATSQRSGSTVEVLNSASPETTFTVIRQRSPAVDGCAHELTSGSLCLEASDDAAVVAAECTDRPEQLWVIENHWHHEGIMWKRLRPTHRLDLCLQQQDDERSPGIKATLAQCGTNWIQQWQLRPASR